MLVGVGQRCQNVIQSSPLLGGVVVCLFEACEDITMRDMKAHSAGICYTWMRGVEHECVSVGRCDSIGSCIKNLAQAASKTQLRLNMGYGT